MRNVLEVGFPTRQSKRHAQVSKWSQSWRSWLCLQLVPSGTLHIDQRDVHACPAGFFSQDQRASLANHALEAGAPQTAIPPIAPSVQRARKATAGAFAWTVLKDGTNPTRNTRNAESVRQGGVLQAPRETPSATRQQLGKGFLLRKTATSSHSI